MAMELSLEPDLDRGGHRYSALLSGEVDGASLRELSDWLESAKQNPDARFVIDLSRASALGRRPRLELRSLMRRHGDLRKRRRLAVVGAGPAARVRVQPRPWPVTV